MVRSWKPSPLLSTASPHLSRSMTCRNSPGRSHRFQSIGFKSREIRAQGAPVAEILADLRSLPRAAVGMSSMGPVVFAISDREDAPTAERINRVGDDHGAISLGTFAMSNDGYAAR